MRRRSFTNLAFQDLSSSNSSRNVRNQGMMYDSPDGYSGPVENNNTLLQQTYNQISQQTIGPDFNPQNNEEIKDLLINAKMNAKFNTEKQKFDTVKLYSDGYKEAKNSLNQIKEKSKELDENMKELYKVQKKVNEINIINKRIKNRTFGPDDTEYNLSTRRDNLENELKILSSNDQNFSGFELTSTNMTELIKKKKLKKKKLKVAVSNFEKYYEVVKYQILDGMISEFNNLELTKNYNKILAISNDAEKENFNKYIDDFMNNDPTYNTYKDFVENIRLNIEDIGKRLDLDVSDNKWEWYDYVAAATPFFFISMLIWDGECKKNPKGDACISNEKFSQNLDTKEKYNLDYIKNDFNNMFTEFKKEFNNKSLNEPKIKNFENKLGEKIKFYLTNTKYSVHEIKKQFNFPTNIYELSEKQVLIFNSFTTNSQENLNYIIIARDLYRRLNDEQKKKFLMLSEDQQNELVQMFIKEIKNQHVVIDSTKTKTINDLNNKITFNSKIITFYFVLVILIFIFFGFKLLTNKN
jgi:hypothetical protein